MIKVNREKISKILKAFFRIGIIVAGLNLLFFMFISSAISLIHVGTYLEELGNESILDQVAMSIRSGIVYLFILMISIIGLIINKWFIKPKKKNGK